MSHSTLWHRTVIVSTTVLASALAACGASSGGTRDAATSGGAHEAIGVDCSDRKVTLDRGDAEPPPRKVEFEVPERRHAYGNVFAKIRIDECNAVEVVSLTPRYPGRDKGNGEEVLFLGKQDFRAARPGEPSSIVGTKITVLPAWDMWDALSNKNPCLQREDGCYLPNDSALQDKHVKRESGIGARDTSYAPDRDKIVRIMKVTNMLRHLDDYEATLAEQKAKETEVAADAATDNAAKAKPVMDMLDHERPQLVSEVKADATRAASALSARCEELGNSELPVNQRKFDAARTASVTSQVFAEYGIAPAKADRRQQMEADIVEKLSTGATPTEVAKAIVADDLLKKEVFYIGNGRDALGRQANRPLTVEETPIAFTRFVECE